MKKFFTLRNVMLPFVIGSAMNGFAQITGDFQTRNVTGNWSDFNAWNVYNGSLWIAATPGQIPTSTTGVYVQAGHTISVDNAGAVCNDLNVTGATTSKIAFLAAGALNVKGNMSLFSIGHNCFGAWAIGAKIVFSGIGAQGFTNLSVNSTFINIEVNKSSGVLTTSSNFRFGSFTLTSGNFSVGTGNEIQGSSGVATIDINGGTWNQVASTTKINNSGTLNSPIGTVNINGGTMILATSNVAGGFRFSTINILNGGALTLNNFPGNITIGISISVDATSTFNTALTNLTLPSSVTFNGIVNYNQAGAQTINAVTYSYLKLSGIGAKTLETGMTTIPANGTLEMSGIATSPTLVSGGTLNISSTGTNLLYSSAGFQIATVTEWNSGFQNVTINNTAGVSMAGLARSISGSLNLTNGTLNIGAGGGLTLDGAPLSRVNGFIGGTTTSDLIVTGVTGGTALLPLSGNISLRNVTVSGTRTLLMDGSNNISLNGIFNIASTANYDNGGESEIINGGGGSINIMGKFITRDIQGFFATSAAIPGITPVLNPGSTIEYGLPGDQAVQGSSVSYQNIIFSGSGTKTPSSAFTPAGTVYITGSAILDASIHNVGDGTTLTNLNMDAGRLLLGTAGTQPMMAGTYDLTGGVIQFDGAGSQTIRTKAYQNIEVTGIGVGNSSGNITLNDAGTFVVKPGGVFAINSDAITGPVGNQTITVENGGIFRCGNNEGFNGFISTISNFSSIHQNIENIILNSGSTVEYMRGGDQPVTRANGLIYSNLLISGTGNKTAPAGILTIRGNLLKSGASTFVHNGGTVLLDGPGVQSFAGLSYNNLVLSNSTKITAGNSIIIDSIKINTGATLSISAPDTITLHSDIIRTARMAQVDGIINYNTTGKFVVERYISAKPAWRFLSVAAGSSQNIKQAWQEGALNSGSDPVPGFGTQITSDRTSWLADGFDVFSAGGPSMKSYNPFANNYTGITTTLIAFDASLGGYMTFVRGNRTAITFGSPVSSTVLRTTGSLFTGNQPDINVVSGKIIPVNNPFASALDVRKISTSFNVFYYVWDPNRGGAFGLGAFQTLSWNGTDYDVVPGNSGSYGASSNFIESGQAFFVSTLGADTLLKLNENAKSSATFAIPPFRPAIFLKQRLQTNLYVVKPDETILADGILNDFGNYSNEVDGMDAKKLANFRENLSIKTGDKLLTIERKHTITSQDTIFLNLTGVQAQAYQFRFNADNIKTGIEGFFEDNYLHTRTPINLQGSTTVNFTIVNIPGSYAADRFRIVFAPSVVLPVTFTSVKAYPQDKNINVEWKVENEMNIKQYEVEKSINGIQFTTLAVVPATANNGNSANYLSTDARPVEGYNYYRVKSLDINDKIAYASVVKVLIGSLEEDITAYPNPITSGILRLEFNNQPAGLYEIWLINKSGQLIMSKQINHTEGANTELIKWNYNLAHGSYQLEITKPDGSTKDINLIY